MKERILTKNFVCMFIAQICVTLCCYTLMSTITEYVTSFGAAASIGGLVSGIYIIGGLCSRLYSGVALDKYGWKKIGLIFSIIFFAASSLYILADNIVTLLIIRFFHGIGAGALMSAIMVTGVADLPKSRYGEATGYFMMSTSLGIALGPFIGGLVYDRFGATGCFLNAALYCPVIIFLMAIADTRGIDPWFQKNKVDPDNDQISEKTDKKKGFSIHDFLEVQAIPVSTVIVFLCFSYAALMSFYRLFAKYTGLERQFRSFFLIYAAMLIVSRPVAGKIQDRFGDNAVCYPCMILQALGIFLVSWKPCMLTIVICALLGALGFGTLNSVLNAIVNSMASDERRSYAISTYWIFVDTAMGLAPAILGIIATYSNYRVLFYAGGLISLISIPVYYLVWGRSSGRKQN